MTDDDRISYSSSDDEDRRQPGDRAPLPSQLTNWQVIEVDGEVVPQASHKLHGEETQPGHANSSRTDESGDHFDDVVVLSVPERELTVTAGVPVKLNAELLNNSLEQLSFELTSSHAVEGLECKNLPLHLNLKPGERQKLLLDFVIQPHAFPSKGIHSLVITATCTDLPDRFSRVNCTVKVDRSTAIHVGELQPNRVVISWWTPFARTNVPVTNLSNHHVRFRMIGADAERACIYEFDTNPMEPTQIGQAYFRLGPGERSLVGVTVLSRRQNLFGLSPHESLFRIAIDWTEDDAQGDVPSRELRETNPMSAAMRQTVEGVIVVKPLIGPWQLAGLAVGLMTILLMLVMTGATMLVALRPTAPGPPAMATPVPAPVFALVLSMDEPVPTSVSTISPEVEPVPAAPAEPTPIVVTVPDTAGLPMVQPDQITEPGQPVAPVGLAPSGPVATSNATPISVAPVAASEMTYEQMFKQIALRYDLNWRLLAAQGYVESGFDSTAVGSRGSLGLMQVHPDTWDEWAPLVDASDPFDTYSNVLVAAIYLDYVRATLGKVGHPQIEWMLAAYNWGPDKVLTLIAGGGEWIDLPIEVQQYAADILRIAQSIPEE